MHYLDDVSCREAAIKPAARRTCDKFEWWHDVDMNGVWGRRPQETFYNSQMTPVKLAPLKAEESDEFILPQLGIGR